jgi:uncharacterized membrane protein
VKTLTGILALSLWLMAASAAAQPPSPQPALPDTVSSAGQARGEAAEAAESGEGRPPGARANTGPYKMPPLMEGLLDDLHNKLIHFPIVLTLVAAVMVIVARRNPKYEPVAFWLVTFAALSVIPAYFTGKGAEEHFEGKPKEWLVELHEKVGITLGILEAIWVLSLLRVGTRRFAWVIGVILAVMVSVAGYLGGLVAHGH